MEHPNMLDMAQAVKVVSADDLVAAFSNYHISSDTAPLLRDMGLNSKHHQLTVEYPCFDLLPPGSTLVLEAPVNILHRERPQKGRFFEQNHPDAMVRIETRASVTQSTIPTFEKKAQLEHIVERLTLAPGFSNLKVVSFRLQGQVWYSFQLQTTWVTSQGQSLLSQEVQNFTAPAYEWNDIRDQGANVLWVKLLETHINRATDFSYLRVQERLERHEASMAQREEDHLALLWDTQPFQSANNVLKLRMKKYQTLHLDNAQDVYHLTCGHTFMCNDTHLMCIMTEQECKDAQCPQCGEKILNKDEDFVRLLIVHDRRVREQYYKDSAEWAGLKHNFTLDPQNKPRDSNAPFEVLCKDFRRALIEARKSFHLPVSAVPHEINFVNYPETKLIRDQLERCLAQDYAHMTVTGEATMGLLIEFATNTLKQHGGTIAGQDVWNTLPQTYRRFVIGWFERTLYLVYMRYKRSEQQMSGSLSELFVKKSPDDSYKLDLSFMGKRRGETRDGHSTFGAVQEHAEKATYVPEENDWVEAEQRF